MCLPYKNINDGYSGFDNILMAFLTIFQMVTFEGWNDIMWSINDATSGLAFAYSVVVVYTGGFFVIELFLAVIADTYNEQKEVELCAVGTCHSALRRSSCSTAARALCPFLLAQTPALLPHLPPARARSKLEEEKAEAEEERLAAEEALARPPVLGSIPSLSLVVLDLARTPPLFVATFALRMPLHGALRSCLF